VIVLHAGSVAAVGSPQQIVNDPALRLLIAPPEVWEDGR